MAVTSKKDSAWGDASSFRQLSSLQGAETIIGGHRSCLWHPLSAANQHALIAIREVIGRGIVGPRSSETESHGCALSTVALAAYHVL